MTAQQFLDLSTKLVGDLQAWLAEAGQDSSVSADELQTLKSATKIVERVTLREVAQKNEIDPPGQIVI
ncbi:MAG: hypothetical protein ABI051_04155 [Vicinamibacterales bacterium]